MAKVDEGRWTGAYVAAILLLAAASAFVYFRYIEVHTVQLNGLTLHARNPAQEIRGVISRGKVIIREELYPGGDERNTAVGVLGAEIAGAYSRANRVVFLYGHVAGVPENESWVNCVSDTDNCSNERIIVRIDPCNCLRIEGGKLFVLYDVQAAKDAGTRNGLSAIVGGVLGEIDRGKLGANSS